MFKNLLLFITLAFFSFGNAQNTVGVIIKTAGAYEGYTLFNSHFKTFLINNCGQLIKEWTSTYIQGNSVYLLENGNLLRTGNTNSTDIVFGGTGGVIELYSWEGNLLWQYFYDTPQYRQNHDVFPMPNGNILILASKVMTNAQAIQAGRNPSLLTQSVLYTTQVVEVQPVGTNQGNIVWQWDMKDHLVQDFDPTKDNFGVISQNPHKLNINFTNGLEGAANWLHVNAVQYNPQLDQIVLSSRNLSEIWVIDHSTTTAQAATSAGGLYGKGGDILWRWGNPQAYNKGTETNRVLFGQHYPNWIAPGLLDAGKIILFNNGNGRQPLFSEVFIVNPPATVPGFYTLPAMGIFGPQNPDYVYDQTELPVPMYTGTLGGANRLPNGNILICPGTLGEIIEIDANENIVWRYINPVNNNTGLRASQGGSPPAVRALFRATKYAPDYAAFTGKSLTPGAPLELNSGINVACTTLESNEMSENNIGLSPNPTDGIVKIDSNNPVNRVEVYNILGAQLLRIENSSSVDLSHYQTGVYILKIFSDGKISTKKVVKK